MAPSRSPLLNVMVSAAGRAARGLKRDFDELSKLTITKKGPSDFVSTADLNAEESLVETLGSAYPEYGFLAEESGRSSNFDESQSAGYWIIDPLDGTTNFLHGIPHWAISIGCVVEGILTAALIFDPIKDEMFLAERGKGASLNGRTIHTSDTANLGDALFGTGVPFRGHGDAPRYQKQLEKVIAETAGVRRFGAASLELAFVACGRTDGFWEQDLKPWDIAAGLLLVRESGGLVTGFDGKPESAIKGDVIAANHRLHPALSRLVKV